MCLSGETCLPANCCLSELDTIKKNPTGHIGLAKCDIIIISLKCNLFSPWYGWKIALLALNINQLMKMLKIPKMFLRCFLELCSWNILKQKNCFYCYCWVSLDEEPFLYEMITYKNNLSQLWCWLCFHTPLQIYFPWKCY